MAKFNTPFIDDEEKMRDFYILSKSEFLASYSYLTEEEYDATYREVYGDYSLDVDDWRERINSSTEVVCEFVKRKYAEGWTEEWDVNLDNNAKVRCFIDKDKYCFKVKYVRNENNVFLPYRIVKIEFLPERPISKKKFKLPVTWEMCGVVEIEAESLEDAIEYFDDNINHIPLPKDFEYVDGSFDLSCREINYLELFQSYKFDKT